jgi:flagellar protein FlbD
MIYLNPDLIKTIEETPDTTICLINGDTCLVLEKALEVVEKIMEYRVAVQRRLENPAGLIQHGDTTG